MLLLPLEGIADGGHVVSRGTRAGPEIFLTTHQVLLIEDVVQVKAGFKADQLVKQCCIGH